MWEASSRTIRNLRTQSITARRLFISAALTSLASLPSMWEATIRMIRKLSLGSEVSLGLRILSSMLIVLGSSDAPPHRYSMIQLDHVVSILHYKFE